jgi:hypothetical protein
VVPTNPSESISNHPDRSWDSTKLVRYGRQGQHQHQLGTRHPQQTSLWRCRSPQAKTALERYVSSEGATRKAKPGKMHHWRYSSSEGKGPTHFSWRIMPIGVLSSCGRLILTSELDGHILIETDYRRNEFWLWKVATECWVDHEYQYLLGRYLLEMLILLQINSTQL